MLVFHPTLGESNVWTSCAKMVRLKKTVRKSVIGNERYLKAKKERESIVRTIKGTNYDNTIWLSDMETISNALSHVNQE